MSTYKTDLKTEAILNFLIISFSLKEQFKEGEWVK